MLNHIKKETDSYIHPFIKKIHDSLKSNIEGIILTDFSLLNNIKENNEFNFLETNFSLLLRNFPDEFNNPVAFDYIGMDSKKYEEEIIDKLDNNKINILYGELKSFLNYDNITKIKERLKSKSKIDFKLLMFGDYDYSFYSYKNIKIIII